MSGHSKWATIKHKKGAADAKRGQMFTKLIKEISIAARMGGGDPDGNPRLRTAILKAKAANMPKDNVDRAIKKGTGELEGSIYEELTYEAYAPGGGAMLIEVLTDNKNRAAAEIRNILTRSGANLGSTGSVSYLFKRKGVLSFDPEKYTEDQIMEAAIDAGADDVISEEGAIVVYTDPNDFEPVLNAMTGKGFETLGAEISMIPDSYIGMDGDTAGKVQRLIDKLEENEDVQNVYHNVDLPETDDEEE
ncbi:MAG: YebC/PmpR family DNA-binding transcriptional regulator [Spirochaetaceae bacterium]|nr:YebC/PmpR family DNA-binding transcriptional regulator [Spirochaetaceae bacterium]